MNTVPQAAAAHLEAVRRRLVEVATAEPAPGLFVRHYRHTPAQTPGWRAVRVRQLTPPGRPELLRLTQVTLAAESPAAGLLKLEVYETTSADSARALLIELLTGFQVLPEVLTVGRELGDADIALPGDRARLVARGNLVLVLASADALAGGIGAVAVSLDQFLTAAPRAARRRQVSGPAAAAAAPAPDAMLRYVSATTALRQAEDGTVRAADGSAPAVQSLDERDQAWHPGAATPVGEGGR